MALKYLTGFAQKLKNSLEVSELITQVNRVKNHSGDTVGPMAEKLAAVYDGRYKSPQVVSILQTIRKVDRKMDTDKIMGLMAGSLEVIARESAILEDRLTDWRSDVLQADNLELKHTHALRFLSAADVYLELARTLMVCIVELENDHLRNRPTNKASIKWLERNFTPRNLEVFGLLTQFYLRQRKDKPVMDVIFEMPDVVIDENVLTTIQTSKGKEAVEPQGFSVFDMINPIFYLYAAQKVWSEFQLHRLELNKEELDYLELRHQELVQERAGQPSPSLDRKIEKYEDEIQIRRTKIKKLQDKLGESK